MKRLLIANRGEIACRIAASARSLGIETVAVVSQADRTALHADLADHVEVVGPAPAAESYLNSDALLRAAARSGADAVHPGYGFLSESAAFARAVTVAGLTWVGPPADAIEAMGDKLTAKRIAREAGVPVIPGGDAPVADLAAARARAEEIGVPVMVKASAGGGGKGMRIVRSLADLETALSAARNEALGAFGDPRLFVEAYVDRPRHIEVQVLADGHGHVIHLGDRDCSIQRRHQKVLEEAPAPDLAPALRAEMGDRAVALARRVGYVSAGTVEYVLAPDGRYFFLEMNTRLQVEHPVTELVHGVDLVAWMLRIARGEALTLPQQDGSGRGHAVEARLYAEDSARGFLPSTGRLIGYRAPPPGPEPDGTTLRIDTGVRAGSDITRHYDPMIAKVIAYGPDRAAAIGRLRRALDRFAIDGLRHNATFLAAILDSRPFREAELSTAVLEELFPDGFRPAPPEGEILERCLALATVLATIRATAQGVPMEAVAVLHADRVRTLRCRHDGDTIWTVTHAAPETTQDDGPTRRVSLPDPLAPLLEAEVDGVAMIVAVGWTDDRLTLRAPMPVGTAELTVRAVPADQADLAEVMRAKAAASGTVHLRAPMPGRLLTLTVQAGATLAEGDSVGTMEAMKMETTLRAPRAGMVASVLASPGDNLAVDQPILAFAP